MSVQSRKDLQTFLKEKGFYFGKIDGIIGEGSKGAILACFQNKKAAAITPAQRIELSKRLGQTNNVRLNTVAKVEAAGSGWFNDGRPKILYERHKFWKYNDDASAPKSTYFNYPSGGNYTVDADKNGVNDSYDKLAMACKYDPRGAFQAISIGMFQVMGFYYKEMGFKQPWEMLYACTHSEYEQYLLLVKYIEMTNLKGAFNRISAKPDDCRDFARGYNGKNYVKFDYHGKLASAFRFYS